MNETTQAILKQRAEQLLEEPPYKKGFKEPIETVLFAFGEEQYAIETTYIREVSPFISFTPIPSMEKVFVGLINIRRRILAVMDLRQLLGLPIKEIANVERIMVLQCKKTEFALLIETLVGILTIDATRLSTELPNLTPLQKQFLKGVTEEGIIVLDGRKLLDSTEFIVDQGGM